MRRSGLFLAAALLGPLVVAACSSAPATASLPASLTWKDVSGHRIAFENGMPVPTFSYQPRLRLDLSGPWRLDRAAVDTDLSLANRSRSLKGLVEEADGRQSPDFNDSSWNVTQVPGATDLPPIPSANGAWYRKTFQLPDEWSNQTVTLKFGAVNYLADVWLNGHYLGYHEGGSTPFAFDATDALIVPGANQLTVRVDNPPWGTRQDIVPWGLTDWWNYAGITQPVWLEATDPIYAARADVVPHLDGADVSVILHQRGGEPTPVQVSVEVLPASINTSNVADPDARSLIPPDAVPIATETLDGGELAADGTSRLQASFAISSADLWTPQNPALYVLHVRTFADLRRADDLYETFGLRRIAVDSAAPRLLLNGLPVAFSGVALHDERVSPAVQGRPAGGPLATPMDAFQALQRAAGVNAQLLRTDHHPSNPLLLMLADRLGFGVWEEIPLYHYTPVTFDIAMGRGIPQQMLTEMDLRDMDHPSVLFHGLANESTGGRQRENALKALAQLDRSIDGTRLTGQAGYGSSPDDATSNPLDVAGYTFYYGVFYGNDPAADTLAALQTAHRRYPHKPILVLEFGRWADSRGEEAAQARIFTQTYSAIASELDTAQGGYVGAAVWWTLDDYWTVKPGVSVEHFGLYRANGSPRPVGVLAAQDFAAGAGEGVARGITSKGQGQPRLPAQPGLVFFGFLAYGLGFALILLAAVLFVLTRKPAASPMRVVREAR